MINPNKVLLVGDVHGNASQLVRAMDLAKQQNIDTLVQLGDFGIWPGFSGFRFLEQTNQLLEELDLTLLFVDGNHEDFDQIHAQPIDPATGLQPWGERLFRMPRGWRSTWSGVRVAALGGAHSVDRQWRLRNAPDTHWEAEHVTEEEAADFAAGGPTDVIFMHDSPAGAPNSVTDDPDNPGANFFPQEELYLAALHRRLLASAVNPTRPALIAHGHYHDLMDGTYRPEGSDRDCRVLGLDEGSRPLDRYTYILDLEEFGKTL